MYVIVGGKLPSRFVWLSDLLYDTPPVISDVSDLLQSTTIIDPNNHQTMVCKLNASRAGVVALLSTITIISSSSSCSAFTTLSNRASSITSTSLYGKKRKGNTPRPNPNYSNKKKANQQQEKASVKEARFDAA